jgi:hypothetical protein
MATGDGLHARAVAKQLGIEEVHGEVKPQDETGRRFAEMAVVSPWRVTASTMRPPWPGLT